MPGMRNPLEGMTITKKVVSVGISATLLASMAASAFAPSAGGPDRSPRPTPNPTPTLEPSPTPTSGTPVLAEAHSRVEPPIVRHVVFAAQRSSDQQTPEPQDGGNMGLGYLIVAGEIGLLGALTFYMASREPTEEDIHQDFRERIVMARTPEEKRAIIRERDEWKAKLKVPSSEDSGGQ